MGRVYNQLRCRVLQIIMNKRRIDLNILKKQCVKGRTNSKSAKYQTVFSFFKQKDPEARDVFRIRFPVLARDLLEAIISYDALSKLNSKETPKEVNLEGQQPIKLDIFQLKELTGEYPVKEILDCLFVQKMHDERSRKSTVLLGICEQRQINFLKKLRDSYSQFCIGEKVLLQQSDFLNFYEAFKNEWAKRQEKGRNSNLLKLEKRIVRCLHVFTALVENSILFAIDEKQKRQKAKEQQYNLQFGTKSQKKKNITNKQQPSTCSKNSTELISNMSIKPMSQKSNEDSDFKIRQVQHSQKSMKIVTKPYEGLFEKSLIGNLLCPMEIQDDPDDEKQEGPQFINLLDNGIQNVLIEQSFKLAQKLSRFPQINRPYGMCMPNHMYLQNSMYGYSHGYLPLQLPQMPVGIPIHFQYSPIFDQRQQQLQQMEQLHQLRRSVGITLSPQLNSNIDTLSVKSGQSQSGKMIMRNSNKSNK